MDDLRCVCGKLRKFNGRRYLATCGLEQCRINSMLLCRKQLDENGLSSYNKGARRGGKVKRRILRNGFSIAQLAAYKALETKRRTIEENGLTIEKNSALKTINTKRRQGTLSIIGKKAVKTKRRRITNGLDVYQLAAIKGAITRSKITENGLTIAENASIKAARTKDQIGEDGLSISERAARKAAVTFRKRLNEYDYQKRFRHALKVKWFDNLHYQGKSELQFLELLRKLNFLQFCKNAQSFKYSVNGNLTIYFPDFQINRTIFEVKSKWTYNHNVCKNNLKIKSCLENNFDYYLVWNGVAFQQVVSLEEANLNLYEIGEKIVEQQQVQKILERALCQR
jgi:hypothetical protein